MHRLLRRQLGMHPLSHATLEGLQGLLMAVDDAYHEADADRALLERSLDLTSSELLDRNDRLRRDIDSRARAERALRHADARMRAILGALPDLMFVASDSYQLIEWHARDPEAYGVPHEVDQGQSLEHVFPAPVARILARTIDEAMASDSPCSCEFEIEVEGERREYGARVARCDAASAVVMVRDHTDQARLNARLRAADRMASIGTLAAGVAHEINNPLAYVITNLDVLAETMHEGEREPELRAIVDEARSGAHRVREIVRDLKVFCHPSPGGDGRADVRRALETALRLAANEIRHRAQVVIQIDSMPAAIGDESRLGQVFLNLLSNAAQAIEPGDASNNEIRIVARAEAGTIVVEIMDTGCGLPVGGEVRIFDPFVTTKPIGVGTGLGLSICQRIITSLGGEIVASSRDPRGALFRVSLPAEPTGVAPVLEPRPTRAAAPTRSCRILIIDDDQFVAAALVRGLKSHDVQAVTDPSTALQCLLAGEPFDVVLCDIMMPERTGVEIYEAAIRERPELASAFIFMSGGVFSARELRFLERVPNARIDKPFDIAEIRRLIDRNTPGS